jgi:hypothetical protein
LDETITRKSRRVDGFEFGLSRHSETEREIDKRSGAGVAPSAPHLAMRSSTSRKARLTVVSEHGKEDGLRHRSIGIIGDHPGDPSGTNVFQDGEFLHEQI